MEMEAVINVPGLDSWDAARERFARILNTQLEIPDTVLRRAMVDSTFAHRLLVSRRNARFLEVLFNDPRNDRYVPVEPETAPAARERSNLGLLTKVTRSLAAWGAAGFSHVEGAAYERRMAACAACPHFTASPRKLVYRLARAAAQEKAVCSLCGCISRNKARMSTESCPGAHPTRPGLTRWGEPKRN